MFLVAVVVAASAVVANVPQESPFVGQRTGWLNRVAAESPIPLPPGPIRVHAARCPYDGLPSYAEPPEACADLGNGEMYLQRRDPWEAMHETGHFFDRQVLTDRDRKRLQPLLRARSGPWDWTRADVDRHWAAAPPTELFADAYADCVLRIDPRHSMVVGYGYTPSYSTYKKVCRLIRRAAQKF